MQNITEYNFPNMKNPWQKKSETYVWTPMMYSKVLFNRKSKKKIVTVPNIKLMTTKNKMVIYIKTVTEASISQEMLNLTSYARR